jgi:heme-degrading monooxygenase HmoA
MYWGKDSNMFSEGNRRGFAVTPVAAAAAVLLAGAGLVAVQPGGAPAEAPARPAGGAPDFGDMLVAGLKETEGCLGVDVAQFQSGKNTIVAWFENKEAVLRWYNHPVHTRIMMATGSNPDDGNPLEHVNDPNTPIMVMASISFDGPPVDPEGPLPFSQISIEMFAPLPGGASVNGRLAPKTFKVPHHRTLDG